jgi:hypothetical protein
MSMQATCEKSIISRGVVRPAVALVSLVPIVALRVGPSHQRARQKDAAENLGPML